MTNTTRERLLNEAKRFENLQDFIDNVGWEDWMQEFVSDPEYTEEYGLEEQDKDRIDSELEDIFEEAQEELQKERENFDEIKLVKEGEYWTLYIGNENCGCGRFEDMVESISNLETYEDYKKYAKECQECR